MVTPKTHIHDHSLFWLGTDTSIKSGGIKFVLWIRNSPFSVMMRSWRWNNIPSTLVTIELFRADPTFFLHGVLLTKQ